MQRLKKTNEFRYVFANGKKKKGKYITIYLLYQNQSQNRIGIVVKKKIGNAVQRNWVKRILREIWRSRCNQWISGYDIVVLAREGITQASFREIAAEFEKLIRL